ncbi:18022_t:CDS:2, partial [Funneliformis geosporum]
SSEIFTIYLSPLKDYVQGYESSKLADLLPNCIKKDQEVIIRDSEMNQLIVVILRNHVGKEVLKYMYETAIETSKISFSSFSSILTDSSIYIPGNFEEHEEHGTTIIPPDAFQV